jgi:hypothetical protein
MALCLTSAGIPAKTETVATGERTQRVVIGGEEAYAVNYGAGQTYLADFAASKNDGGFDRLLPLIAKYDPTYADPAAGNLNIEGTGVGVIIDEPASGTSNTPGAPNIPDQGVQPFLIIGETDYTDVFTACLNESLYEEPGAAPAVDSEEELALKQLILEATLAWAACAREHGVIDIVDPDPPVADGYMTTPTALLPMNITVGQLTALLQDCPNFDAAVADAREDARAALGGNPSEAELAELWANYPAADPSIGFAAPGFDGRSDPAIEPDPETAAHLTPLWEIITSASMNYWAEQQGTTLGPGVG